MKNRIPVLLVFGFVFYSSCGVYDDSMADLYEEPSTVELMIDLYVGEVVVGKYHNVEKDSIRALTREKILSIYDLTDNELDSMLVFLQSDLPKYARLSKVVSDSLNARQKRLHAKNDKI